MSIQPQDYRTKKERMCQVCEQLFSEFGDDNFITVKDKSCLEVLDEIKNAIKEIPELKNADISKYIYIVSTNGSTLIKR